MTTQSEANARRQQAASAPAGYDPDALHRVLDYIGNIFGHGHSNQPSGGSRVLDWIGRQLASEPPQPATGGWGFPAGYKPPPNPAGWKPLNDQTRDEAYDPVKDYSDRGNMGIVDQTGQVNPFYRPPVSQPKPVTKISSAPDIAKIVQSALGGPSQPYIPLTQIGGAPGPGAMPGEDQRQTSPWPPPMGPNPADMGGAAGLNIGDPYSSPAPIPGAPVVQQDPKRHRPTLTGLGNSLGSIFGLSTPEPGGWLDRYTQWRNSPFGTGQPTHAQGGPVGLMRGGYPELYGSQGAVRHTFDSGGQNYVNQGDSSGRADDVNAKLSPKEYVMDSESMSLLGDGNPDHGAKKMDEMRVNLRRHKGQALAKGKFSPKAKSAQEYLVGDPMGDGLRRRGRDKG